MSRRILVPLDGSAEARAALPVARSLAELHGASLCVVHVGDEFLAPAEMPGRLGLDVATLPPLILESRQGDPVEVISHCAGAPDTTIVMSTRGAGGTSEGVGPVPWELLSRSLMPLVLVPPERGERPWRPGTILLPHDGTPSTTSALDPAAELARLSGARVRVLYVAVPGRAAPHEPGALTMPRYLDQPHHEWPAWAGEFLERLGPLYPLENLGIQLGITSGSLALEVLDAARRYEVDLVVLVGHGHLEDPERARVVRGVLAESPCPVMLLDAEAERHHEERALEARA